VLIIDPGHGGSDPGAIGPAGTREADVNLVLAYHLADLFPRGKCYMTRVNDSYLSTTHRARLHPEADAFISLHCNSVEDNPSAEGFEIWTSPGVTTADALATSIFKSVVRHSSEQRRFRCDWADHDCDKEGRFTVLLKTPMPAVLVEVAFISNHREEQLLRDDRFLRIQADAIAQGIEGWLT